MSKPLFMTVWMVLAVGIFIAIAYVQMRTAAKSAEKKRNERADKIGSDAGKQANQRQQCHRP